jgi:bifunctional non-homologous end joining protein LigD
MGLSEYNRKRNFAVTSEPSGEAPATTRVDGTRQFVIQKHAATRLHYDFRLELEGVLKSWSVPKGPSLDTKVKRLAMHVEDHPLAYAAFEGIIPKGEYGGGTVLLWDQGTWEPLEDPHQGYAAGNLKFILKGEKLQGGFALVKIRDRNARGGRDGGRDDSRSWLLIKERDGHVVPEATSQITEARPESVTTGRTLEEIAADRSRVWYSNRARVDAGAEPGAEPAPLPKTIRPPRFAPRATPPAGAGWLHELAIAGERLLGRSDGQSVQFLDGAGRRLAAAAARPRQALADAIRMLPAQTLLIDGVLAAMTPDGHSDAEALPAALAPKGPADLTLAYWVFDLPYLDGRDLTHVPLERRKSLLAALVRGSSEPGPLRYLDHVAGSGADFRREAKRLGIAAMISRKTGSFYDGRAGWLEIPCAVSGRR